MARDEELLKKYKRRLENEFSGTVTADAPIREETTNYVEFKKENMPKHHSLYEKFCNKSESIMKIKPDPKKSEELKKNIKMCHLDISPSGVMSFAIIATLLTVVFGGLIGFLIFKSLFFLIYSLIVGVVVLEALLKLPNFMANNWRLKSSNQMVQCIFYVVTYMRHTSNLELAIKFSAEHLAPPLSIDFKKVLWDVETGKFSTVKESLDNYLETWREWNLEFIEAFHMIEGSLYETSETRRLSMIDKSLDVMLEETYEKMLHYAHDLKGPITMLYMLGIILPILGLVILPLLTSFMTSSLDPIMLVMCIALLYNITLPIGIYYLGKMVLSKRPTGYGDTDISNELPSLKKYKSILVNTPFGQLSINPLFISAVVLIVMLMIGLSPMIAGVVIAPNELITEPPLENVFKFKLWGYKEPISASTSQEIIGPYGLGSSLLSILVPLGLGVSIGLYFKLKAGNLIKIREKAKKLEAEFSSALFQLGTRLGDGIPAELAFGKVAVVMKDTSSGNFFGLVSQNIRRLGMSVQQAIFNKKSGALIYFPSSLIESSMKVLIESSKKGPKIASQALINVADYIKEIHRVNERLRDLMSDIISDMKQQINVLAPAISGIVVGITSMIIMILGRLTEHMTTMGEGGLTDVPQGLPDMFGDGVPTYYFQLIVGIYVVQIIYILTVMTNGIENGSDKLSEEYNLGKNMIRSTLIYCLIAFFVIAVFNLIAASILSSM
ncbi:MAG: hypothetical protein GY861_19465 [bacterium]|nr:hypothetical protein [bacterium]